MKARILFKKELFMGSFLLLSLVGNSQHQCLTAHFPFNGNASDSTSSGVQTSMQGTFSYVANSNGAPNSALHFNATDSYIDLNGSQPVITTTEFSISIWAKMDGAPGGKDFNGTLFEQRDDNATSASKSMIVLMPDDNNGNCIFTMRSSISVNAGTDFISIPRQDYNEWHHYLATKDADSLYLYIDGVKAGSAPYTQTGDFKTSIDNVGIGVHRNFGQIKGLFNGDIDQVKLYDCAVKPADIDDHDITSFRHIASAMNFEVFPNPAKSSCQIQFPNPNDESLTLRVFDAQGKLIKEVPQIKGESYEFMRDGLTSGVYFFKLSSFENSGSYQRVVFD